MKITFDDGSTYSLGKNERKALYMKYPDRDPEEVLTWLADAVDEHWEERTVPTKFGDESWTMYAREHTDELPSTEEIEQDVADEMGWDEQVRSLFGTESVPIPDPVGMEPPMTAHRSGGKVYENPDNIATVHLPHVEEPSTVEATIFDDASVTLVVLPEEMYEEYVELELAFQERVCERMNEHEGTPFEDKSDLASPVAYQHFRAPLMSLAMAELGDGDGPGVIGLSDDGSSVYKGDESFHVRR